VTWSSLPELLRACIEGDELAWVEFIQRFHPVIAANVMRCARRFRETRPELIDDLVQETLLKVCAHRCRVLREFQPRSPDAIFGFLKTVAFSVTMDHFRIGLAEKRGFGRSDAALDVYAESAVAGSEGLPEIEREILLGQIDQHLATVADPATGARDHRIFWLYYQHGMTARAIAAIPGLGLTQKGVESVIQRLTSHVRALLGERDPGPDPPAGEPKSDRAEGKRSTGTF
jgi:RNA polymerase sigma factor (sigma-70 family)